jgi:hypothetical protein
MKEPWTLLAIISAVPGAYLSFRGSLFRDLRDQMIDLRNSAGVGITTIPASYRLLAYIFIGKKERWIDLLDPTSHVNRATARTDKTDGLRIFLWFFLTFSFLFLGWLSREGAW